MSESVAPASPNAPDVGVGTGQEPRRAALGRAATVITLGNLISRITGFVRVIAVAGALGIAYLGDAYQRANEVSNVLFELLAGGLLFSILVPSFVEALTRTAERPDAPHGDEDPKARARRLGSVLATRGAVGIGLIALAGMVGGTWIMRLLTIGVPQAVRDDQIRLGAFLLWFIMPQLVFYAAGAVASALLQADHRFLATSVAPVFNNIVVTVTMIVFAAGHPSDAGLTLTMGEKVLLGGGTLAGTVAMTIVPFVALWNAGLSLRPRWNAAGLGLGKLVGRGAWAAGHVGLNEVLIGATIILAGRVDGGVIAYQTAFMFFLLPHALVAYPIFTALFPRLSKLAAQADLKEFSVELTRGMRWSLLLLVPSSGLLAVVAAPALSVVRIGRLDDEGVHLVATVLAGFLVGLTAFSVYFLLTRAAYALEDARSPTVVNVFATGAAVAAMITATTIWHGTTLLVSFGLIQAITTGLGAIALFRIVQTQVASPIRVVGALGRSVVAGACAVAGALVVTNTIGWETRAQAVAACVGAGLIGLVVDVTVLGVLRTPELSEALVAIRRRLGRSR